MFCLKDTNESAYDRLLRAFVATLLVLAGLFWFDGAMSLILYVIAGALFINALTGVCEFYKMLGISTFNKKRKENIPRWLVILYLVFIAIILLVGILGKIFLV